MAGLVVPILEPGCGGGEGRRNRPGEEYLGSQLGPRDKGSSLFLRFCSNGEGSTVLDL
jgi:hypothetical protein